MRKSNGKIIDINASAKIFGSKYEDRLAVHALTGCDLQHSFITIGKGKVSAVSIL